MANPDRRNIGIDLDRLMGRITDLGGVGALPGGGVCRLALTEEDRQGRDLVVAWMKDLGLEITVDRIGNVMGLRRGAEEGPPVVVGSHIDTVATGGLYDGALGVLAGLEAVRVLNDAGIRTKRPITVAFFTNEEGSRFHPDMMGSAVLHGILDADEILASEGIDGTVLADDLERIGYAGDAPVGSFDAHCYLELHVEQGPVLDDAGIAIGAVTGVQGIYWTEYRIEGVANHAGTTPMDMRHDAGYVAASIAVEARRVALEIGGNQVAAAGYSMVSPCLVNVIPGEAVVKTDLRNTGGEALREADERVAAFARKVADEEGCGLTIQPAARFDPVWFDPDMIESVEETAMRLGHKVRRMPSGAGHDAQMFAPSCPTAMIFVPSRDGISHNTEEYTAPEQIRAGADVLLNILLEKAEEVT
ncbi:MAG: M20 family metallo-hydrolase [Rhodospirillales bacterium]|nr:M20 family metallo-hydrolase [Rhodospirillales bacterium]